MPHRVPEQPQRFSKVQTRRCKGAARRPLELLSDTETRVQTGTGVGV
jgi:hypothetical protein